MEKKKHKRHIIDPYKKWSKEEEEKLLLFLKENCPIEKPTSQLYYRRFIETSKIETNWNLVRCKVRNMRQSFQKTKNWQNSIDAGVTTETETMQTILRKCPHFFELEEIFGCKEPFSTSHIVDTEMQAENEIPDLRSSGDSSGDSSDPLNHEPQAFVVNVSSPESSTENSEMVALILGTCESDKTTNPNKSCKGIYSRTLSDILQVKRQMFEMKSKKNDMDIILREKELELQRERFLFDRHTRLDELKLKQREIESIERIKMAEIRMKEKIALKELEIKERVALEELKRGKCISNPLN